MKLFEKQINREEIFRGKIIDVYKDVALLENGKTAFREVVHHPGGVAVAALTDKRELLFVKQFRYPYGEAIIEIPAGKLEPNEEPAKCGRRELLEETGASAAEFSILGTVYPSPGYIDEKIYIFFAENLSFGDLCPDEDEFLEVIRIPIEKAYEMVMSGEIKDAKTQIAVLKVFCRLRLQQ